MARKPTEELIEAADALQDWNGMDNLGAAEVLVWWGKDGVTAKFALRGPALRIELSSFVEQMLDNCDYHLDISIQNAMGLNVKPWLQGSRVVGIKGGLGQTLDYGRAHVGMVMDSISRSIEAFFEERGVELDVFTTLMPNEGSPWEWNEKQTYFYNAKKKQIESTPRPDWIVPVEVRATGLEVDPYQSPPDYVKAHGADFCELMPTISADPDGPMACRFERSGLDFMVTHCLDVSRVDIGWAKIAKFVNSCGGLLFPSMAVSQVPGVRFGPVCLVVNPMVVLEGMKPYFRRRGSWPIVTYSTDVWTEVTRDFLSESSAILFDQLTGQWDISVYGRSHFYILGPPVRLDGPMEGSLILNTKKLSTKLSRRVKKWTRDLNGEEVEEMQLTEEEDRYPYLEAKSNGIVSVDALVACVAPSPMMRSVKAFLDAIGFQGDIIQIKTSREEAKVLSLGMDYGALYDYSWRVFDAVMEESYAQGRVERVVT